MNAKYVHIELLTYCFIVGDGGEETEGERGRERREEREGERGRERGKRKGTDVHTFSGQGS
jgi:hypothetical protein